MCCGHSPRTPILVNRRNELEKRTQRKDIREKKSEKRNQRKQNRRTKIEEQKQKSTYRPAIIAILEKHAFGLLVTTFRATRRRVGRWLPING